MSVHEVTTGTKHDVLLSDGCTVSCACMYSMACVVAHSWRNVKLLQISAAVFPLQVSELRKLVAKQLQLPSDRLRLVHKGATLWDGRDTPILTDAGAERNADETSESGFAVPSDMTLSCCTTTAKSNLCSVLRFRCNASSYSADSVLAFVSPNIQTAKPSDRHGAPGTAEDDEERFR